ncbi:MAG: hypothetical protein N2B01_05250 [Psychrobacter cryohalolentis]|uniref:hypothetical protein n=1 Tax=Psychrobacter sp. S4(2024) TaxID=3111913 RepID=UPI001054E2E2
MSDKKDKQSADLEANLAKIANTKPRLRNRKHNIYERYITRVESAETIESTIENTENELKPTVTTDAYDETDVGLSASLLDSSVQPHILQPLKNADKLSSYEPLSAAELELFGSQEQDNVENTAGLQISDNASTSVSLDFSDEDEKVIHPLMTTEATDNAASTVKDEDEDTEVNDSAYIDEPISPAPLTTLLIKKSKKKKAIKLIQTQKSSKKTLIIGMVLGSLMISGAVFTLIATGFLSTGNTSTALNEAGTPINENATQTSPVTKQTATDTEINTTEKNVVVEANKPPAIIEVPSDSDPAKSSITKPATNAMNNNEAAASTSTSKPAITYEDFREESQNTLYRETND